MYDDTISNRRCVFVMSFRLVLLLCEFAVNVIRDRNYNFSFRHEIAIQFVFIRANCIGMV